MGKTTDTIKALKSIRGKYEFGSEEYTALTTAIKSITGWTDLNTDVDNMELWGFEDVPERFQLLTAIKNKVHTLVRNKLKEMGVR